MCDVNLIIVVTPLHVAILARNGAAARLLIENDKVDVNAMSDEGWTPMVSIAFFD
jgi:ankyrin repeat protein